MCYQKSPRSHSVTKGEIQEHKREREREKRVNTQHGKEKEKDKSGMANPVDYT